MKTHRLVLALVLGLTWSGSADAQGYRQPYRPPPPVYRPPYRPPYIPPPPPPPPPPVPRPRRDDPPIRPLDDDLPRRGRRNYEEIAAERDVAREAAREERRAAAQARAEAREQHEAERVQRRKEASKQAELRRVMDACRQAFGPLKNKLPNYVQRRRELEEECFQETTLQLLENDEKDKCTPAVMVAKKVVEKLRGRHRIARREAVFVPFERVLLQCSNEQADDDGLWRCVENSGVDLNSLLGEFARRGPKSKKFWATVNVLRALCMPTGPLAQKGG